MRWSSAGRSSSGSRTTSQRRRRACSEPSWSWRAPEPDLDRQTATDAAGASGRDDVGADRLEHLGCHLGDAVRLSGVHSDLLENLLAAVLLEACRATRHRVATGELELHGFLLAHDPVRGP